MSMRYPGGLIATTPVNQQYPSGVWTGPQTTPYQANNVWANDSSFRNTTLLLHGDGATTSFTRDASTNNFQLTLAGDTKPNNLTPFITNGYWSNNFNGSSYLTVPDNSAWVVDTDYTVEFWCNATSFPGQYNNIFNQRSSGSQYWGVNWDTSLGWCFFWNNGSGETKISRNQNSPLNTWVHFAFVKSGTTGYMFLNGVQAGATFTIGTISDFASLLYIGVWPTISDYFAGYISNMRFVKGTALYTNTFTPSTTPLTAVANTVLLTCQSNRFIDNSTNVFAITTSGSPSVSMQQPFTAPSGTSLFGSGYFDGSGDYVTSQNNNFASNNFTIEGWFYPTTIANLTNFWGMNNGSGSTPKIIMYINSSGNLTVDMGNAGTTQFPVSASASTYLRANAWNHIAAVRSGTGAGQFALYINGTSVSTGQLGTNISNITAAFNIGYIGESYGQTFSGYISNFRVVNGTAVYTGNFTPSTAPLTPVTNTSLLTLQTNGPENNNGFLDSSLNSFPITRNGNTTQGSFTPYEPNGYWSNYFDGSGDYLSVADANALDFAGDFTVEAWVFVPTTSGSARTIIHKADTNVGYALVLISAGNVEVQCTSLQFNSTSTLPLNQWNHVAMVRSGSGTNNVKFYLNGVLDGQGTNTTNTASSVTLGIGAVARSGAAGVNPLNGYISNVRTVASAVYTSAFTPSTTPLTAITNTSLLTCQSNRFIDNSTNAFTITRNGDTSVQAFQPFSPTVQYTPSTLGGSGYFDGSGDSLSSVNTPANFGSNNFTAEAWVWFTSNSGGYKPIMGNTGTADYQGWVLITETNNALAVYASNGGSWAYNIVTSYVPSINCWTHLAYVRNGTTLTLYVNGVSIGTAAISTNSINSPSGAFYAGYYPYFPGGARSLNGYISDLRLVNGTAVYTSAFTPPTAPLTAITNTSLLLNCTNAAIFDNSGMSNLETVGNAQIDTSVVKYGTSSMYFDGSGDYLDSPTSAGFGFGTGNYTVEFWIYLNSLPGSKYTVIDFRASAGATPHTIYVTSSGYFGFFNGSADVTSSSQQITARGWYHVAYSRGSGVLNIYVSGVSAYSAANTIDYGSSKRIRIGGSIDGSAGSEALNGYIDDLRITKGVARYVNNFTPPIARMPNQ